MRTNRRHCEKDGSVDIIFGHGVGSGGKEWKRMGEMEWDGSPKFPHEKNMFVMDDMLRVTLSTTLNDRFTLQLHGELSVMTNLFIYFLISNLCASKS